MKRLFPALLVICLLLTACGPKGDQSSGENNSSTSADGSQTQSSNPYTFTDSLGNEVSLDGQPKKVVALMGSYAETWLLAGGQLAGVTQDAFDERGLELTDVVNLGSYQEPDFEAVLALEPDFVILSADVDGHLSLADSLSSAGIPAAWFKVEAFADYLTMLNICTHITGREDLYQENGLSIQSTIDATIAAVPEGEPPVVLLLRAFSTGVKAKNNDNLAGVMINDLGGVNIADSETSLLEDLQMEAILAADPDYILVVTMGASQEKALASVDNLMNSDPAWQALTAVKDDHVVVLDKSLFHYKPNNRWGESYEALFNILYPEA